MHATLADSLMQAARLVPVSARHGGRKVWLCDAYASYAVDGGTLGRPEWLALVASDAGCRGLMARCDMPFLHAAGLVESSECGWMNARFHFVKLPR